MNIDINGNETHFKNENRCTSVVLDVLFSTDLLIFENHICHQFHTWIGERNKQKERISYTFYTIIKSVSNEHSKADEWNVTTWEHKIEEKINTKPYVACDWCVLKVERVMHYFVVFSMHFVCIRHRTECHDQSHHIFILSKERKQHFFFVFRFYPHLQFYWN